MHGESSATDLAEFDNELEQSCYLFAFPSELSNKRLLSIAETFSSIHGYAEGAGATPPILTEPTISLTHLLRSRARERGMLPTGPFPFEHIYLLMECYRKHVEYEVAVRYAGWRGGRPEAELIELVDWCLDQARDAPRTKVAGRSPVEGSADAAPWRLVVHAEKAAEAPAAVE